MQLYRSIRLSGQSRYDRKALSLFETRPASYNCIDNYFTDARDRSRGGRTAEHDEYDDVLKTDAVPEFGHLRFPDEAVRLWHTHEVARRRADEARARWLACGGGGGGGGGGDARVHPA